MKFENQDRIDEYLLNRMSNDERRAFEEEVDSNEELRDQLSFTEDVQSIVKSRNEKLAKMEKWKGDYEWQEELKGATKPRRRARENGYERRIIYVVSGVAAVFIAGIFLLPIFYFIGRNTSYKPGPIDGIPSLQANANNSDIEYLINHKEYDMALVLIEKKGQMLAMNTPSFKRNLEGAMEPERYYGKKGYHEPRVKRVIKGTGENSENEDLSVKEKMDELKWLKVYALLGLQRYDEALQLLDELRSTEGFYQSSADTLYKLIKR